MFGIGGFAMSRNRGSVVFRAISAICVTALVLAACGGSDSSSNRNGRLNSTLCFDTQAEKDAAIADAQQELDEATTPTLAPTLEEAAPFNNGGRATLAFVGPQLWWMHTASGGSTSTTTQPATTTSTTSTSTTSTSTSTSSTSSTSSTVASSTDSTDVSTDSTDVSTETSIPLVGEMVLQQLQDELDAVTNAPLCSEVESEEASDTTLDKTSSVECNANAGFDLNTGIVFVTPCEDATAVRFLFDSPDSTPIEVLVENGSSASAASAGEGIGFSFEVLVESLVAVTGTVAYPSEPEVILSDVSCSVDAGLTPVSGGWLIYAETCDATTHWDLSYTDELGRRLSLGRNAPMATGSFAMTLLFNVVSVGFSIYVDETLIAEGELSADAINNDGFSGTGTYQVSSFGTVESSYSGSFVPQENSNEELEITEGWVSCSATVGNGLLNFLCAQPITTSFAWATNDAGGGYLAGDESTVYSIPTNIHSARFWVSGPLGLIADELFYESTFSAIYEFLVPIVLDDSEDEGVDEGEDDPFFSGTLDPAIGENTATFTIPETYAAGWFMIELYAACENQTMSAILMQGSEPLASFVDMTPYHVLNEGLCGVWLVVEDFEEPPLGQTFEIAISAETETQIEWSGTVFLEGSGISQFGDSDEEEQDVEWEEAFSGEINADSYFQLTIPSGGRRFEAIGITNQSEVDWFEPFVDPILVLYDANGDSVDIDDDGGENRGYGELSSRLSLFLAEGEYTLLATTYDLYWEDASENTLNYYDLLFRIQSINVESVTSTGDKEIIDEILPEGVLPEELTVQVVALDTAPTNLEPPQQPVALPIDQLVNTSKKDSDSLPVIPAGVSEVVCDSDCLSMLRDAAGIDEGVVTIQVGGEVVEIQPGARKAIIPVRSSANDIRVTVTPTGGGEPVVLSTETLVISPRTFPTDFVEGAKSVMKSAPSNGGIPTNLIVVLTVLALAIAIGLIRGQKVRLPEQR